MNFLKRTMPLMITAGVGFVLIVASFIPATVGWGEVAAVWFDILAAVAFILGGGNLVKMQLKKISDRSAGWGYAIVTLVAFLVTLTVGLFKVGAPPAANQEFYGQVWAELELENLPESQTFRVPGQIPRREIDGELPASVRQQLSEENGELVFRGWILPDQVAALKGYSSRLEWLCAVEQLAKTAQPPEAVQGKVSYLANHEVLAYGGVMTDAEKQALLEMGDSEAWTTAVKQLDELSDQTVETQATPPPNFEIPESLTQAAYHAEAGTLAFTGPMSVSQRDLLINQFPIVVPITDEDRAGLRQEIESRGQPLTEEQRIEFDKVLDGAWTPDQLIEAVNAGGIYKAPERTACELLEQMGQEPVEEEQGEDVRLTPEQEDRLRESLEPAPPGQLAEEIGNRLGELNAGQQAALEQFLNGQPTLAERNHTLYYALLKSGPVTPEQKAFLLADIQAQTEWTSQIAELFGLAHQIKYAWSGEYRDQGTPFWWIYEFLFKPLTATMFALLAFYVASAAFRAFRAKNVEASLLLGTAFIILLGRTFAGVLLTSWMPEELSGLRIENLAVYIMQVFNTAGNRAIMIGIALGIASTSLKVLLGIDRSYLGSSED